MSYILNALRKSEQERQAKQAETVTEQVLHQPPPKNRKTAALIGGILAANLLLLALLVWYLQKADDAPARPRVAPQSGTEKLRKGASKTEENKARPVPEQERAAINAAPAREVAGSQSVSAPAAAKTPSLQEMAAARQSPPDKAEKPVPEEHQTAAPAPARGGNQGVVRSRHEKPKQEGQAGRAQRAVAAVPEAEQEPKSSASNKQQAIPFFKDLPYDFRNAAPKMAINVFVYAERPEDRFIVMNMEKYKTGQTTKDAVEIKEIRADSVVASYGGRTFRIERP
ncbi:MAG: general secretion pathway protein GspB [Gammaproteobacteria bacterium]